MRALVGRALAAGLVAASGLLFVRAAAAATIELKNDGFVDGANVSFMGGFAVGEQGASTLGPVNETFTVSKVRLLFGPGPGNPVTVTLNVFEDIGGSDPGAVLYMGDVQIIPASDAMSEIDLSADNVTLVGGGSIRVAVQFQHGGPPAIARDDDGSIQAGRNWIYTLGSWFDSQTLALTGDWIIRADAVTQGAGGSGTGGSGTGGSGTGAHGGGSLICVPGDTQPCVGPGACAGGQSCLESGLGWGPCQCAAPQNAASSEEDSGCSLSGSGRGEGTPLRLGALAIGLGLARRRRRAVS
jgi:hypothetical protein